MAEFMLWVFVGWCVFFGGLHAVLFLLDALAIVFGGGSDD
jgi:hypothetical protein